MLHGIVNDVFIRKNKNRSGTVSVQVVSKTGGSYHVVFSAGASNDPNVIERLVQSAQAYMLNPRSHTPLFVTQSPQDALIENFIDTLTNTQVKTLGPELIFGTLFDAIGFNAIPQTLFRHLTIARLAYPTSKLKTVDYLYRFQGTTTTADVIYKWLDRFGRQYKALAESIVFEHTKKILTTISVVFYDMTTLYFEAEDEDDLRKIGYSKDGKFQCPQIMIGLLIGEGGYPIGYDVFEGNTFEGHTLVKTLEKIGKKYKLGKPVTVADAAMLSKKNIEELKQNDYTFIVGGRVKNESERLKAAILQKALNIKNGESFEVTREDGTRLVVTYSDKRAKKDRHNREKGVLKLKKKVASGTLTKTQITNRGYNKFLSLSGKVTVTLDEQKIIDDSLWDGLKGYVTNTTLSNDKIVEQYGHLWQIEKAFRISKTDLRVRPIYHRKKIRIEAHLTIAFVAYAIWKELERHLARAQLTMTPKRAAELTQNMYAIDYVLPHARSSHRVILKMDAEQQALYDVIHG